jgi:TatD DNase family protein
VKLPVIIHSRDAAKDTLDIMKAEKAGDMGGVVHCFSYGKEIAREYLDMGFFLGIGGVSTFNNAKKLKEVVEYAPLESLVLETDCPYLSPVPNRGKRNSSLNLSYVVDAVSALKGVDRETVIRVTWDNALRLYGMQH